MVISKYIVYYVFTYNHLKVHIVYVTKQYISIESMTPYVTYFVDKRVSQAAQEESLPHSKISE